MIWFCHAIVFSSRSNMWLWAIGVDPATKNRHTLSKVWRLNCSGERLLTQSAIVVGNVGTYFVLFARCDRYSRSEEDGCKQEEFQVLVHDIVCFRGEYSDLLMLFCRCHDNDSSVYLVVEEAL